MDKKKIAIGILGLGGIAALAYYLYQRSKASALPANTTTADIPANANPVTEGKLYRTPDGKTYQVRGGVLRWLVSKATMQRELGTSDWDLLLKSGIATNVKSLPSGIAVGPQLAGLTSVLV